MNEEPEQVSSVSRRAFIKGSSVAGLTFAGTKAAFAQSVREISVVGSALADEGYWAKIRDKFYLQEGLAYLNNGTVGPTPGPVYQAMVRYWRMMAENPNENSAILQAQVEVARRKLAQFVGAPVEEVAILRNTTEGNNLVCQGIDLKQGDEVLIGTLEHDSNRQPWKLKAKRQGICVKEVSIGTPPRDSNEILTAFQDAISPRTKVISLAHCDTVTGTFTPIKAIAELAHSRGIHCFVDGAQALGMVALDLHDLGVDTYAATCHKWLDAPAGAALLYVRREMQDRIWPNIVTENWWSYDDARKYDCLSRQPWPVVAALEDALDFQLAIGPSRIEERMRALATYLRREAAKIPDVKLFTSNDPQLSGGITSLQIDNRPPTQVREYLRQRHDTYVAGRAKGDRYPADPHGVDGVRISTHYYNTFEQVDRVLEAFNELASGKA